MWNKVFSSIHSYYTCTVYVYEHTNNGNWWSNNTKECRMLFPLPAYHDANASNESVSRRIRIGSPKKKLNNNTCQLFRNVANVNGVYKCGPETLLVRTNEFLHNSEPILRKRLFEMTREMLGCISIFSHLLSGYGLPHSFTTFRNETLKCAFKTLLVHLREQCVEELAQQGHMHRLPVHESSDCALNPNQTQHHFPWNIWSNHTQQLAGAHSWQLRCALGWKFCQSLKYAAWKRK